MERQVDATGLALALALVRLRQALERVATGETVDFQSDAPGIEEPLLRFVGNAGHELVTSREEEGGFCCSVRKGEPAA